MYSRVLEVQFHSFAVYCTFQKNARYAQVIRVLLPVPWICCVYNNMVLYWTLINSYWHSCITKVLGKWQLVGGDIVLRVPWL